MLYKNLPDNRRVGVMATRYFLDYLAALQKLLSGNRKEALAIVRARFEYSHIRHEFDNKRKENLAAAVETDFPEMKPKSLLWAYYFKGIRKYSDFKK